MTIVYSTNAGSTERYAKMLSEKLSCPMVKLADASDIGADEEVIYMSWIMSGSLTDYAKAKELCKNIRAVCAVGMFSTEDKLQELIDKSGIEEEVFFLRGAFSMDKLSGMYKMMMGMALRMIKSKLKESDKPEAKQFADMIDDGIDFVNETELEKVLQYLGA